MYFGRFGRGEKKGGKQYTPGPKKKRILNRVFFGVLLIKRHFGVLLVPVYDLHVFLRNICYQIFPYLLSDLAAAIKSLEFIFPPGFDGAILEAVGKKAEVPDINL